jgi:peptidyl-prolyl cis-trans isomerase C
VEDKYKYFIIGLTFSSLFTYTCLRLISNKGGAFVRPAKQGGVIMGKWNNFRLIAVLICFVMLITGCNSKKEEKVSAASPAVQKPEPGPASEVATGIPLPAASPAPPAPSPAKPSAVVVEVNGVKFTKGQFDAEMNKKLSLLKAQVPADRLQQIQPEIKKQVVDDFVIRTLLSQEFNRLKIAVTEQEVKETLEHVKSSLPPGASFDDLLKKNNITNEKFREEMVFGIKINKVVLSQPLAKAKPTEKEISKYYQDNKNKFKAPETVHARHILVAKNAGDGDKTKADKKAKAETLRKQLLDGADFADVAAKNSDCPSKSSGGDLGTFSRGQMVKPFEDAAFAQKVNAIGPIVETDFGYHIIQVLEHSDPKVINLDDKVRAEIGLFLQQQKKQEAFADLLKKLRARATIIVPG